MRSLGSLHGHTAAIDTALQLTTALVLVRLGVYLLRVMMGPDSWIRSWENRITLRLWLTMSFSLVGWLDAVENTLNHINLIPGKTQFSLWALLKGLVIVSAFVVVTEPHRPRAREARHAAAAARRLDPHRHLQVRLFHPRRHRRDARHQRRPASMSRLSTC